MVHAMKRFYTKDGPIILEFDFIPPEPTPAQLAEYVPQVCATCEWKGMQEHPACSPSARLYGGSCGGWEIGPKAYTEARIAYYRALHRRCYG